MWDQNNIGRRLLSEVPVSTRMRNSSAVVAEASGMTPDQVMFVALSRIAGALPNGVQLLTNRYESILNQ